MNDVTAYLAELGLSDRISDDLRKASLSRQFIPELNRPPDGAFYDFFYSSQIPQMGVGWSELQDRQNWDFKHQLLPLMKHWAMERWPAGPGTVFDLGCGSGLDLCFLARFFPHKQFLGLDSSAPAKAHVEHRARRLGLGNVSVQIADAFGVNVPRLEMPASMRAGCDAVILNNVLDSSFPSASAVASKLRQVRQLLSPSGQIWLSFSPVRAPESEMERCVVSACRRAQLSIEAQGRFDYTQESRPVRHLWWSLSCLPESTHPWWRFWR